MPWLPPRCGSGLPRVGYVECIAPRRRARRLSNCDGAVVRGRTVQRTPAVAVYFPFPACSCTARASGERGDAGQVLAKHQRVDLVGTLVGDDRFQVDHVADDGMLQADAVAAEDRPGR